MTTDDNGTFTRRWFEVSFQNIGLRFRSAKDAKQSNRKWFPYNKGGEFRKWYGNNEFVVNWRNDGADILGSMPFRVELDTAGPYRQQIRRRGNRVA